MDRRGSYDRKTGQVKGGLHRPIFEILAKLRFENYGSVEQGAGNVMGRTRKS